MPRNVPADAQSQLPAAAGETDGRWRSQRAAAARNHERVLDTARELLRTREAGAVDVREIASAAGVGVGTIYRRFGGKAELLAAVVDAPERDLQDMVLRGPPPLGPGAPPLERLVAFVDALAQLTEDNLNVLLATDLTGRRRHGAYQGWRLHVTVLLEQLRPDLDQDERAWHADVLLAVFDPGLYAEHRRDRGLPARQIAAYARSLAELVAAGSPGTVARAPEPCASRTRATST